MKRLEIYCVTDKKLPLLEETQINLCSVNERISDIKYIKSNIKNNIFYKEKNYSELTFHYWYWKNILDENEDKWIGFSQKEDIG